MHQIFRSHHPARHVKSFKHAFEGIFHALANEANFRVQVLIVVLVVLSGFLFKIENVEWAILVLTMGALLSAEMLNTVVEELMDFIIKEEHPAIKIIKDLAAGFVLVTAITTLIIILLVFGHRIF